MRYRKKADAINCVYLQSNPETMKVWMLFDIDHPYAWFIPEERGLPTPTYISVNRANGHAHVGYLLEAPVPLSDASRAAPIRFFADIERAFTRRLGADMGYNAHTTRNPLHRQHETDWQSSRAYRLDELNDSLDKKDKVWLRESTETTGTGRNITIFGTVRKFAYKNVLKFKKDGKDEGQFRDLLMECCHEVNRCSFKNEGLSFQELWGIARSISKWVWKEFTLEKFSLKQSYRASLSWKNRDRSTSLEATKPWLAAGISRRSYYSRKAANKLIS